MPKIMVEKSLECLYPMQNYSHICTNIGVNLMFSSNQVNKKVKLLEIIRIHIRRVV